MNSLQQVGEESQKNSWKDEDPTVSSHLGKLEQGFIWDGTAEGSCVHERRVPTTSGDFK